MSQWNDSEIVMVRYMHPNRGQHRVVGQVTRTDYGYRGGGDQFLVHTSDVSAQPQYFQPITVPGIRSVPTAQRETPPPPPVIAEPVVTPKPAPVVVNTISDSVPEEVQDKALGAVVLDLQVIPGVTPAIERGLKAANLDTPKAIIAAGIDGLQEVQYIGATKAIAIVDYVTKRWGATIID